MSPLVITILYFFTGLIASCIVARFDDNYKPDYFLYLVTLFVWPIGVFAVALTALWDYIYENYN